MLAVKNYSIIPQRDEDSTRIDELDAASIRRGPARSPLIILLSCALVLSLAFNVMPTRTACQKLSNRKELSKYAGLTYDSQMPVQAHSRYDSIDREVQESAWASKEAYPGTGAVALDESYALSLGLPHSMRWPWDERKGVYVIQSFHEMHCVQILRTVVNNAFDGKPLDWPYHHTLHCLHILRETVTCHADDTPLYTGHIHSQTNASTPVAGMGYPKVCRSWEQLQQWADTHSACYNGSTALDGKSEIERYKYCPDGSQPWLDGERS